MEIPAVEDLRSFDATCWDGMSEDTLVQALAAPAEAYHQIASYWTDQYDINLQVVGAPVGDTDVVRGDPASGKFLVFHLIGGRMTGLAQPADLEALANPAVDLAALT